MIKPLFLAVLISGKNPESLILLDLFATDDAFLPHILSRPVDVEGFVSGSPYKLLSFSLDLFHFWFVDGFYLGSLLHYDGLPLSVLIGSRTSFVTCYSLKPVIRNINNMEIY